MSIDRISAQHISRVYVQQGDNATQTTAAQQADKSKTQAHRAPTADSVTLSHDARSLAAAREAVQQAPDVRDAKVDDIKQRVQDGTYSVPSRVLARKMIDSNNTPS